MKPFSVSRRQGVYTIIDRDGNEVCLPIDLRNPQTYLTDPAAAQKVADRFNNSSVMGK